MKFTTILSLSLLASPAVASGWIPLDLSLQDRTYQFPLTEPRVVSHLFPDFAPEAADLVDHYARGRISVQQIEAVYADFLHQLQGYEAFEAAKPSGFVIFRPVERMQQGMLPRGLVQNFRNAHVAPSGVSTFISETSPLKTKVVRFDEEGYDDIRKSGCGGEISDSCDLFDAAAIKAVTLQEAWNAYLQQYSNYPEREFLDTAVIADALKQATALQKKTGGRIYAGIIGVGAQGPLSPISALSYALLIQVTDRSGQVAKGGQLAVIAAR